VVSREERATEGDPNQVVSFHFNTPDVVSSAPFVQNIYYNTSHHPIVDDVHSYLSFLSSTSTGRDKRIVVNESL
jgi:hypothetical protein